MITFENITKRYATGVEAVHDVSLQIEKGEFAFIVGPSGCGKSTLMKLLLKEIEPTAGRIYINGKDITNLPKKKIPYLRRSMGIVFQDFRLLQDKTVYDNVAYAMRVIVAIALVNNPMMLIADEPTGNLDPDTAWEIMSLLNDINRRGTTVVVATHAKEIVDKMQKRVIAIEQGVIHSDIKRGVYTK